MLYPTVNVDYKINSFLERKTKQFPEIQQISRTIFRETAL